MKACAPTTAFSKPTVTASEPTIAGTMLIPRSIADASLLNAAKREAQSIRNSLQEVYALAMVATRSILSPPRQTTKGDTDAAQKPIARSLPLITACAPTVAVSKPRTNASEPTITEATVGANSIENPLLQNAVVGQRTNDIQKRCANDAHLLVLAMDVSISICTSPKSNTLVVAHGLQKNHTEPGNSTNFKTAIVETKPIGQALSSHFIVGQDTLVTHAADANDINLYKGVHRECETHTRRTAFILFRWPSGARNPYHLRQRYPIQGWPRSRRYPNGERRPYRSALRRSHE